MFQRLFKLFSRRSKQDEPVEGGIEVPDELEQPSPVLQRNAKYSIGDVLQHRIHPFRGIVFDIDPEFANTEEWYESIPEDKRPHRNQPYYHLFAENENSHYVAYVSEQNLELDRSDEPLSHPEIADVFDLSEAGYALKVYHSN